jgi:hypothetical protein
MRNLDINVKLTEAIKARSLVRLTRKVEAGHADGYVLAKSDQWLLLLLIGEGVTYAGFRAFRLRDVSSLQIPSPYSRFYQAALRMRRLRRPATPKLNLSTTQELVQSAGTRFPLVTLHREKADPEVCHIGRVASVSRTSASLLEITPHATWEESPTNYRLAQVTRVDVGGPYEEALSLVATANPFERAVAGKPSPAAHVKS